MINTSHSASTNARLAVPDITRLLAEIGDLVFTRNQIEADQEASRRAMDEACVPVKGPFLAEQEKMAEVIQKLAVSIEARAEIIEEWCLVHKDEQFEPGRRTLEDGGMLYGFRRTNPRVEELPATTRWQRFVQTLSWRTWGRAWLRPAPFAIDKRKVISDAPFFEQHPWLLRWLGLSIVQQDEFVLKPTPQAAAKRLKAKQEPA